MINVLAFEQGPETDKVIQKIHDFMDLENSAMANITLQNLTGPFALPMHEAKHKDARLRTQKADWLHETLKHELHHVAITTHDVKKAIPCEESPSSSQVRSIAAFDSCTRRRLQDICRDLLYYLEKNVGPDANDSVQHIYKFATGECNEIPTNHYKKIKKLLKRPKQRRKLEELLLNEAESTNYKTYFLGLLIMESVLRPYIKRKITLIHTAVANEFTRPTLCDVADTNDICRVDGVVSDEVKFKHDCKETPQCSKFLQCVLDKRSPKGKQKQYRMFKRVNPQDCLTNVWDFAKLFMDPWMHTNKGFEDLDVFCLLTLLENVDKFNANQSKVETLQQKVNKARYDALTVLQMGIKTMKKHTMNVRLHGFIYILEEGNLPVAYRAIQQLKDLIDNNKGHFFNIRLDREAKRQHSGQSLKKAGQDCYFKSILALKSLNPVFVDIVEGEINKLHEQTVNTFGPKPCPRATSDDICKSANNTAKFRHKCPPETLVACQKLLDIIKEHTAEKVPFCSMLKGTDPQIWLDSPFDYARIFLKKTSRLKRGFEDCDLTALCGIVERCKPLINMFNNSLVKKIGDVRNLTMHAAGILISQQDMEDNFDAILEFLQYIKSLKDTDGATEAIDYINQLQACDIRLLSRLFSDLIDGELPDTIMTYMDAEDKAKTLRQKIRHMKRESDRYCSLEEHPDSPSPGCYDEETTKKKGTTETLFSGDEDSSQPSTSSMRERSGRGEQTRDEPTDRARGAKRVLQETGSEERLLMKKRKMAEHIREMSEEQVRAVLMETLNKDPDLMAEVIEETTSI